MHGTWSVPVHTLCDSNASGLLPAEEQHEHDSQALAVSGLAGSGELVVRWPEPEARPGVYQRPAEFRKRSEVPQELLAKRRREELHTLRRLGGLEDIHFEIKRRTRGKDGFKRDDTGMGIEIGEGKVVSSSGHRQRVPGPGEWYAAFDQERRWNIKRAVKWCISSFKALATMGARLGLGGNVVRERARRMVKGSGNGNGNVAWVRGTVTSYG